MPRPQRKNPSRILIERESDSEPESESEPEPEEEEEEVASDEDEEEDAKNVEEAKTEGKRRAPITISLKKVCKVRAFPPFLFEI